MEEKTLVQEISHPIFEAKGWMKLVGVMSIISGVLMIFSIFGIVLCWLPIWMGVLLFKAGSKIELAKSIGEKIHLIDSLMQLRTYFIITGVMTLIGIIIGGIALMISGGAILTMLSQF